MCIRSDGSGTTHIFSNDLSSVDRIWAAKVDTAKTLNWPTNEGAEGNGGVATEVSRTPFSIGYIEEAYSQGLTLPSAAIRDQAGNYAISSAMMAGVASGGSMPPIRCGVTASRFPPPAPSWSASPSFLRPPPSDGTARPIPRFDNLTKRR